MTNTETARTRATMAHAMIERLDETYDLVYVDYRDRLTAKQTAALVRSDLEKVWASTDDFESEGRWSTTKDIIRRLADDIAHEWEVEDGADHRRLAENFFGSEESETVQHAIEERDRSDWFRQLVQQTPSPLLRVLVLDEDHAFSHQPVAASQVLSRIGVPDTDENRCAVDYVLDNASPEYSTLLGFWVFSLNLETLYDLHSSAVEQVTVVDPHLYLGDPRAGSGFLSELPIRATVRMKVCDLRTDGDAFGYSLNQVYDRPSASTFETVIAPDAD